MTRDAVALFRDGYVTLLFMLTGYYNYYSKPAYDQPPALTAALAQTAFAPVMTMFIRSLAEVIAFMPADDGGPAGVVFDLTFDELRLLEHPEDPRFTDVNFYRERVGSLVTGLRGLIDRRPAEPIEKKLQFIAENMYRVLGNLGQIYQHGVYPAFDPAGGTPTCPTPDCCD
jgi:hypothetical protein